MCALNALFFFNWWLLGRAHLNDRLIYPSLVKIVSTTFANYFTNMCWLLIFFILANILKKNRFGFCFFYMLFFIYVYVPSVIIIFSLFGFFFLFTDKYGSAVTERRRKVKTNSEKEKKIRVWQKPSIKSNNKTHPIDHMRWVHKKTKRKRAKYRREQPREKKKEW